MSGLLPPEIQRQLDLGFSLIPLATDGSKQPHFEYVPTWKPYAGRFAVPEELRLWFSPERKRVNVGVVTGKLSNLIVLDLDDDQSYADVTEIIPWIADETMVARTGKGWHIYFRPLPSSVEKEWPATTSFLMNEKRHHFKAEPAYVQAPPSVHENGNTYHWINGHDPMVIDPSVLVKAVIAAGAVTASPDDRVAKPRTWIADYLREPCPEGGRNERATSLAGWLRNTIKFREDVVLAILLNWSDTWCRPPMDVRELENLVSHKFRMYAAE